ncbi:hypothetical protein [Uliginosibacterium sp. 31-12]|uniref:hypothetical protein n=1 Tax=Uliginosibacterium sp. 31-12 TaxID=3062781 RepID=UPI0026E37379|nr:hypothetical protein [Uliginosibacterium sp. 31-12]MDO6388483.1 hypothetical protein [Uliginosibacterium sp. 31-12]
MLYRAIVSALLFLPVANLWAQTTPTKQAEKQGFTFCKPAFERVTNAVIRGEEHIGRTIAHGKEPNKRAATSQIAVLGDISPVAAIVSMSRSAADDCDAEFTTVYATERSCEEERSTKLSEWKSLGANKAFTFLENPDGDTTRILMQNGKGCVIVTNRVAYGVRND